MNIRHHLGKGTKVSDYFKSYAEEKLEKLKRMPFDVSKVDVTAIKEGSFYTVELCIKGKSTVRASASTHDFMESLDCALSKALKQISKLKLIIHENRREKRRSKKGRVEWLEYRYRVYADHMKDTEEKAA